MERLTSKRVSGIKSGYWTQHKKDELTQALGPYEDTGLTPAQIRDLKKQADNPSKPEPVRWISVEDRLPEAGAEVLILRKSGSVCNATKLPDGPNFKVLCVQATNVTHWMPMPEGG